MKVMLDTNICIFIIKQRPAKVLEHFKKHQTGDVGISSITLSELHFGVAKSQHREKNMEALQQFLLPLEIAPFGEEAALAYGGVRAALERAGTPIGSMDLLIASHAMSEGVALITNNTKEFLRVPGLQVMDWTE